MCFFSARAFSEKLVQISFVQLDFVHYSKVMEFFFFYFFSDISEKLEAIIVGFFYALCIAVTSSLETSLSISRSRRHVCIDALNER